MQDGFDKEAIVLGGHSDSPGTPRQQIFDPGPLIIP